MSAVAGKEMIAWTGVACEAAVRCRSVLLLGAPRRRGYIVAQGQCNRSAEPSVSGGLTVASERKNIIPIGIDELTLTMHARLVYVSCF